MKAGLRISAQGLMRRVAARAWSRALLNGVYLRLRPVQRRFFHNAFAKIYRGRRVLGSSGAWKVRFCGKTLRLPLRQDQFWLDWDCAMTAVGHDVEVIETYRALVDSTVSIDVFVDIGSNYGTHSLLFLVHGIQTISFEPNKSCHEYFHEACDLNGVTPELIPLALGEEAGRVKLAYPERDTWYGTVDGELRTRLAAAHDLRIEVVERSTLDDQLASVEPQNVLVKIDTEGSELAILRGAAITLQRVRPYVIFESLGDRERVELFGFFQSHGYRIHRLPWAPASKDGPLDLDRFVDSPATNFMAAFGPSGDTTRSR